MICACCGKECPDDITKVCGPCENRQIDFDTAAGRLPTAAERARAIAVDMACIISEGLSGQKSVVGAGVGGRTL